MAIDPESSDYLKYWPQGRPTLWKIKPDLVLEIPPPQFQRFWEQRDMVQRPPTPLSDVKEIGSATFQFLMPDFSGFTPQNYRNRLDEDLVDVVSIDSADLSEMAPDVVGSYPPNMLRRFLAVKAATHYDERAYRDLYGLRCYPNDAPKVHDNFICYGART